MLRHKITGKKSKLSRKVLTQKEILAKYFGITLDENLKKAEAKNQIASEINTLYTSEFALKAMSRKCMLVKINIIITNFEREFKKINPVYDDENLGFDLGKIVDFQARETGVGQKREPAPKQNYSIF